MKIDLSKKPSDPPSAIGYDSLYILWKSGHDAFERGDTVTAQEFAQWTHAVRLRLTEPEKRFFDAAFPAQAKRAAEWLREQSIARLGTVLLDRHLQTK